MNIQFKKKKEEDNRYPKIQIVTVSEKYDYK